MDWGAVIILLVFVVVFGAGGIGFLRHRAKIGREIAIMAATETTSAAKVAGTAPGTLVEMKGVLRCAAPVTGQFSGQPAAWFNAHEEREIVTSSRNSRGRRRRSTRRETVTKNVRWGPCAVADETGQVAITFEGAEVEGIETSKRFEAATGGGVFFGGLLRVSGAETGRHYTETALAVDQPVYVLATVQEGGLLGASADGKAPFVISHKSEEERTKSLRSTRFWTLLGGLVFLLVAVACAVAVVLGLAMPK